MKKQKKMILLCCIVGICLVGIIIGVQYPTQSSRIADFWAALYDLPADTTASQLESDGFVNLSGLKEGRIPELASFFSQRTISHKNQVNTFTESEDGPVIRVFNCDETFTTVTMCIYHVAGQYVEGPAQSFLLQSYEVKTDDGITQVWLAAHNLDGSEPLHKDFMLYQYTGKG